MPMVNAKVIHSPGVIETTKNTGIKKYSSEKSMGNNNSLTQGEFAWATNDL